MSNPIPNNKINNSNHGSNTDGMNLYGSRIYGLHLQTFPTETDSIHGSNTDGMNLYGSKVYNFKPIIQEFYDIVRKYYPNIDNYMEDLKECIRNIPDINEEYKNNTIGTLIIRYHIEELYDEFKSRDDLDVKKRIGSKGLSLLDFACLNENYTFILYLLNREDIDINQGSYSGTTSLMRMCGTQHNHKKDTSEIVELLLDHPDINIFKIALRGRSPNWTALTHCCRWGKKECIKLMVNAIKSYAKCDFDDNLNRESDIPTCGLAEDEKNLIRYSIEIMVRYNNSSKYLLDPLIDLL